MEEVFPITQEKNGICRKHVLLMSNTKPEYLLNLTVFQLFIDTTHTNAEIINETKIFYSLLTILIIMGCSLPLPVLDFCTSRRSSAPNSCCHAMTAATRYAT